MMDITELHDEENLMVQLQDRWENYGTQNGRSSESHRARTNGRVVTDEGIANGIADTEDPFTLQGAPKFELAEKIDHLLSHALTEDDNLLLRQTLGLGCKQRSIKELARQQGTTQKAVQVQLVRIVQTLREHDDSIQLWKYLNK